MCSVVPKMCNIVLKMCSMVPKMCGMMPKMCGMVPYSVLCTEMLNRNLKIPLFAGSLCPNYLQSYF